MIAILAGMLLPALNSAREKARRISCVSNLKQIGTAFALYTNAGEQLLPISGTGANSLGTSALQLLVDSGNLTDAKVYVCPSSTTKEAEDTDSDGLPELSTTTVSYAYIPGLDATSPGDSGVAADGYSTATNHTDYGNILFADGHVTPSTGTTTLFWINKANWYAAPTGGHANWRVGSNKNGPTIL